MGYVTLVFHGDLKNFLSRGNKENQVSVDNMRRASVKDGIEAAGIPHTEVGSIVTGEKERDFSFLLKAEEKCDIFPITPPFDVTSPSLLRPEPYKEIRFLVDVNVAKLSPSLRMLGFDVTYQPHLKDSQLAELAHEQKRIILSRDRSLLKRSIVQFGRLIRSEEPFEQLREVVTVFGLKARIRPFTRCMACNGMLYPVDKQKVLSRLEPKTRKYYDTFSQCCGCQRVFWAGSHYQRMLNMLRNFGYLEPGK